MPYAYQVKARVRLERVLRSQRIQRYLREQSCVRIISHIPDDPGELARYRKEDLFNAFWRTGAAGYTSNGAEAGIFTGQAAWDASHHCGPEKGVVYEVLRQVDQRTQEEMSLPRVRFKGCTAKGSFQWQFRWEIGQSLPPPAVGRSLTFDLVGNWGTDSRTMTYEVDMGDEPPTDLAQLARWHKAAAFALANLPEPLLQIPLW